MELKFNPDILGDRADKKFKNLAESKETQLHSKDADAGYDRAEARALNEVAQEAGLYPYYSSEKEEANPDMDKESKEYVQSRNYDSGGYVVKGGGKAIRGLKFTGVK